MPPKRKSTTKRKTTKKAKKRKTLTKTKRGKGKTKKRKPTERQLVNERRYNASNRLHEIRELENPSKSDIRLLWEEVQQDAILVADLIKRHPKYISGGVAGTVHIWKNEVTESIEELEALAMKMGIEL